MINELELLESIPNFDLPGDTVDSINLREIIAKLNKPACRTCKHWKQHSFSPPCPMIESEEYYDEDNGWDYMYLDKTKPDGSGYCNYYEKEEEKM